MGVAEQSDRRVAAALLASADPRRRVRSGPLEQAVISGLKNIAALIEAGGEITLGHLDAVGKCVASAADDAQCIAMLVRRRAESLDALLSKPQGA